MKVSNTLENSFLRKKIDKTKKCVFNCYVCLTFPCLFVSIIKFIGRM